MRHTLEEKISNVKNSLENMFKDCKHKQQKQPQIQFHHILNEESTSNKKCSSQSQLKQKLKIAIHNSVLAHQVQHRQLSQQCMKNMQILKQIDNQISVTTSSKILSLKLAQKTINKQENIKQPPNSKRKKIFGQKGILLKYSPSMFGGWSERYCILEDNKFYYLQTQHDDSGLAGVLNFNVLKFFLKKKLDKYQKIEHFEIKLQDSQKSFIFKGQTGQATDRWCQQIERCISETYHNALNIKNTSIYTYPRFWRKNYISAIQFSQIAQTGDILLYRSKKSSAILQRKMTNSQYDHIGVILKNCFNEILVFQANGGFGVGICPWKKFIKNNWFKDQQLITYRSLKIQRNEQLNQQVSKFVEDNIGKQYKFPLTTFLLNRTSTGEDEKTTYFCSSLVAKLYKTLGLLDPNKSSNRYFPSDFAEKAKVQILKGRYGEARLKTEKIIVFGQNEAQNIHSSFIR